MSRKGFCLPKKLKQIRLRVRKAIKRKKCPAKVCVLPTEKFEYIDPDHIELWFYGWCARGYRKDFPSLLFKGGFICQYYVGGHRSEGTNKLRLKESQFLK